MPKKGFSIQAVAREAGVSAHTLRYYERVGLMGEIGRCASGHRNYSRSDCDWIVFLSRMRSTGMPIRTLQRYARLRLEGEITARQRREILEVHRAAVCEQKAQLEAMLDIIDLKITRYRQEEEL